MSSCQNLTLSASAPTLTLTPGGSELTLTAAGSDLTLVADACELTLQSIDEVLTFEVTDQPLVLQSDIIDLSFATPVPVGTGEANVGSNCGAGAGVYRDKQGETLRFRTLASLNDGLAITENDPDCSIDFEVKPGELHRYNVIPTGDLDGTNVVYTLPEAAIKETVRLYRNGVRQAQDDAGLCDFTLTEGGGAGAGYDTVTMTTPALLSWEQLTADYLLSV